MTEPIPDDVTLPCGCFLHCAIEGGEKVLTITACRAGCPTLAEALQQADEHGREVEIQELRR